MITVRVDGAIRQLTKEFAGLTKPQVAKATSQAINQTLLLGRTEARRAVKKVYNIPQRYMSRINYKTATSKIQQGWIYASSKPIPMDAFNPKYTSSSSGKITKTVITKRGVLRSKQVSRASSQGLSIEVKKGDTVVIPYAFLLPNAKPRVFARGEYKVGNGSYGFIQRHTREENASGHDSVKPLISITVFGAVVNPVVKGNIKHKLLRGFPDNMIKALKRQAGML